MAKRIDQFNLPYRPNLSISKEKVDSLFGLMNLMDTQQIKQFSMINNVPLNVDDINGENLIHKAINIENILKKEFHRLNVIKFLVQNSVNPDKPNKDNQTPLHLACKYQYADIIEYLVSLDVDLNYKDNFGCSPFHYVLQGQIKLMDPDREIRDFIPAPKKIDLEKKNKLIEIKKELWNVIKDSPFIASIQNTVGNSIYSDKIIKDKALQIYQQVSKSSTTLTPENYLKLAKESIEILRNSIESTVRSKWNDFPELKNIEIHERSTNSLKIDESNYSHLKEGNIREQIKSSITKNKEEIQKICSDLEEKINKNFVDEENIDEKLKNIYTHMYNTNQRNFTEIPTNPPTNTSLLIKNIPRELANNNQIKEENLHPYSYDMADNVIDWNNKSFFGGSREVDVVYDFKQIQFILDFATLERKVFYILLNVVYNDMINVRVKTTVDQLDNNIDDFITTNIGKLKTTLDPTGNIKGNLIVLIHKFIFDQDISQVRGYLKNDDTDIHDILLKQWLEKVDKKNISKASLFYGLLTSYQCLVKKQSLKCNLVSPILNLTSAIEYSQKNNMSLDDALNNSFKKYFIAEILNDNPDIVNVGSKTINEKIHACINVLLTNKLTPNLNDYFRPTLNTDILGKIVQLNDTVDNKIDIYFDLQKLIMEKISVMDSKPFDFDVVSLLTFINKSCYNEKDKCDTNYYRINELPDLNTLFTQGTIDYPYNINNFIIYLLKSKNNTVLIQYIYILLEANDISSTTLRQEIDRFSIAKLKEANHLGLYFNGLLPDLNIKNTLITISSDKKSTKKLSIYNPRNKHQFVLGTSELLDNQLPLFGNYIDIPGQLHDLTIDTQDIADEKLIKYFKYEEGKYRPPIYDSDGSYDNLTIKVNKDKKRLFQLLNRILYTGEDKKNVYSSIDSNSAISTVFIEYYPLMTLLTDIIDFDEIKSAMKNIIASLNTYNGNLLLYYHIFSPDKLLKIPKFNYYELPQLGSSGQFLYFNDDKNIDLNNLESVPVGTAETIIPETKNAVVLNNYGKNMYRNIQQNVISGKYEIRKESLISAKTSKLPPSLKPVLSDFYRYNLISLLIQIKDPLLTLIDQISELNLYNDSTSPIFSKQVGGCFVLSKLVEELVKENMKNYIQTETYRIVLTTFGKKTPESKIPYFITPELLIPPIDFALSLNDTTFNEKDLDTINPDLLISLYQFSKKSLEDNNKFIIYPDEYANSEILRSKYELIINDKSFISLLKVDNINPYILDSNNQSAIYPVLKLHNFEIVKKLKGYLDFRVYNDLDGNLTSYEFLLEELKTHIQKISGDKIEFKDWIENFVIYQKNEIKTLIFSNDKFGNNIPQYLEDSFNVICYLTNQYLSESIYKIDEEQDKTDVFNYFGITKTTEFGKYLYANENLNELNIYSNEIDNIIQDLTSNLNVEISKINKKILKLNNGNTRNKYEKVIESLRLEESMYLSLMSSSSILVKNNFNENKILARYQSISDNNGVLTKMLSKLINMNGLNKSLDLLTLKSLEKENSISKTIAPKLETLKPIRIFYDQTNKLSNIYFEFGKYCNDNKVLTFVRELLLMITVKFLIYPYYLLIRKVLTLYFKSLYPNDKIDNTFSKVDYCLTNDLLKPGKKSIREILLTEVPIKLLLNSVQIFNNEQEEVEFTQQSIKEILDTVTDLLTVNPVFSIPSDSPIMKNTIKEINAYFDTFTNKTILNWLVVIENVFKFNINQGRIIKSIDNLLN